MTRYLAIRKRVVRLLIFFFAVAFFAATVVAAESFSPTDKPDSIHTSSRNKTLLVENSTIGILNATSVNIRQGHDFNEKIIGGILKKGTVLKVLDRKDDWIKIYHNNTSGWVYGTFVDIKKEEVASEKKEKTLVKKCEVTAALPADTPTEISETINREGAKKAVEYKPLKAVEYKLLMTHGKSENAVDLMHVYKLAIKNDPSFQSARYRHEASPEIIKQAYSELLPSVNADTFYQHTRQKVFNTDIAVYGNNSADFPGKGYNLVLTQPLFRYSSIMRVLQAKKEVKSADLKFEAARQDLILRVAVAYIKTLEAYENLEFTCAEEEALKLHFELAQARYDSGFAPITDFHDANARLAFVTVRRVKAKDLLDDAFEALAELTGKKIDNLAKLKYAVITRDFNVFSTLMTEVNMGVEHKSAQEGMPLSAPDPDVVDNWIDAALKQNLGVRIRQQDTLIARKEIERQKAGHWPVLTFVGRLNRNDEGGSLFGGDSDVETKEAILRLNVPIFQGGSVSSKTREALKLYRATRQDLEKEIRAVKRETKAGFLGVKSAIKNTRALTQSVVSNQIALEAKKEGFKSGLFPGLVVIDAERDLHQAKSEYAKAQYEYILNSLRLKKAVSALSEEELAGINQWLE